MKKQIAILITFLVPWFIQGCGESTSTAENVTQSEAAKLGGQSSVQDSDSNPNVVQVAVGSEDHSTLVSALQAAEYVDALTNVGPFTVFAPTNDAFDQLPEGTLENLTQSENQRQLRDILEYHVLLGVYKAEDFVDNRKLGTADGRSLLVTKREDGSVKINGAKIIGTLPASNGIIHVVDQVLLPK
ncbi:fasciclin domain-containing protein [Algoriphagus hitonicola]|uniref:Uncaracterized surface protein containing fasciclin (FAS1) repeats n=1 Tax=Algoriphagus hitonicola TaxID=435880 RepID=A0A1I2VQ08_9BACT|nr:fasciclin domain-containing protein [Algoriphagus hitonicola]SFG90387.1 Uncaracterized surface protein containing fasciclin (FAS1) repeats [Algoriphagus hitonicola]